MTIQITEEQTAEIGHIMTSHWGCHAQTGHTVHPPTMEPQTIVLWIKMGPNMPARAYDISPDGTVTVDGIEWDGREKWQT